MNIIDLINNFPAVIGLLYVVVELMKAWWKHSDKASSTEDSKEERVTQVVFDMLEQSKRGLVEEKLQITQVTELLKRANFEISILERKVATLMSVIDRFVRENPKAHDNFDSAMKDFNAEIDNMRKIKDA